MPPKPFYEIDPSRYLQGKTDSPVERIRQWVLFELLSTYGYNIRNIQLDILIKVDNEITRVPIIVLKDSFPFTVVTCYEDLPSGNQSFVAEATQQADVLNANFVVITDGSQWIAKKQFEDNWCPVVDIPMERLASPRNMTSVLWFVEYVKPLLYWVDQAVPKTQAQKYFEYLMEFFQSEIRSSYAFTPGLIQGTDYFLRILGHVADENPRIDFHGSGYELNNLIAAQLAFNQANSLLGYHGSAQNMNLNLLQMYNFREILNFIVNDFRDLAKFNREISGEEALLIKMVYAVAAYLWDVYEAKAFLDIPPYVIGTINSFLNQIVYLEVGATLPEPLDDGLYQEMRSIASKEWK